MGRPAFAAVFKTSMPTPSIAGRASRGLRHAFPLAMVTHSGHNTQMPPVKPVA